MTQVTRIAQGIVEKEAFRNFIFLIILFSAVLVGLETYSPLAERYSALLSLLDRGVIFIFVVEIALKILARGSRPLEFFKDPWNVFDFLIVGICLIPAVDTHFVAVLRVARVLRVLRMISLFPKLQLLIGALLKSLPSMGYVILLLSILFYIYAVLGSFMFGQKDPLHFGNLHLSLITLFKVLTLEGWTDILNVHLYDSAEGAAGPVEITSVWPFFYFVSFILVGAMIVMNLFIGVIMNSMEESQKELEARIQSLNGRENTEALFRNIVHKLDELKKDLDNLKSKVNSG